MTKEIFIDGIGQISVQGPIVTVTFTRTLQGGSSSDNNTQELVNLTMAGTNLVKITNVLNNTLKKIAERNETIEENTNKISENSENKKTSSSQEKKSIN